MKRLLEDAIIQDRCWFELRASKAARNVILVDQIIRQETTGMDGTGMSGSKHKMQSGSQ